MNPESKLEQAAKEFAEGLMGIGEYSEKWHSGDKSLFHAIVRGVRHGANWQSLTTPASNEVEGEAMQLIREFVFAASISEDENELDHRLDEKKWLARAKKVCATPSKPHTIERPK